MSLTTCYECNKPVSTEAKFCPNCGAAPRLNSQKNTTQGPKNWRVMVIMAFTLFIGISGYNAFSDWSEKKAKKKAEVDEYFRRNSLTPEQKIAEDAVKAAQIAKENADIAWHAKRAAKEEKTKPFRGACQIALKGSLNDPSSFSFSSDFGDFDETGSYVGYIDGRAKNGFGALIVGRWKCSASQFGSNVIVDSLVQISPRIR